MLIGVRVQDHNFTSEKYLYIGNASIVVKIIGWFIFSWTDRKSHAYLELVLRIRRFDTDWLNAQIHHQCPWNGKHIKDAFNARLHVLQHLYAIALNELTTAQ